MSTPDATVVIPPPDWSDPRIHLLDDTWLLTIFATLLATVVPWAVSGLDIDFIAAALGILTLGAIHIALTSISRPSRIRRRRTCLSVLHMTGIAVVGFVWLQAGGLQNPAFLLVFALPVVGAIFLSRWQPYLMALVAILIAGAVALTQAPELRWYVPGLDRIGTWIASALQQQGVASAPFPGFYAPSSYYVVLFEVFAIFICACAVAAEYLGTVFERLYAHVDVARAEAERSQEFWTRLIEQLPQPALLVDSDTMQIVSASRQAEELCEAPVLNGRPLFDALCFSYPDVIQQLISESGGVASQSMLRVGSRLLATRVHVQPLQHSGQRLALLLLQDQTEELALRCALDVVGQAVLVIDPQHSILSYNKPALALFAGLQRNADAARMLALQGMPPQWWEPGITGRRRMHVEIGPRIYQVTCASTPLPGEDERLYVATILPVARAAVGDQTTRTTMLQIAESAHTAMTRSGMASPP